MQANKDLYFYHQESLVWKTRQPLEMTLVVRQSSVGQEFLHMAFFPNSWKFYSIRSNTQSLSQKSTPLSYLAFQQIAEYLKGSLKQFQLPLDWEKYPATPFQKAAWQILTTIPLGQTITYGQQAQKMGHPFAYQAVGQANKRNPWGLIVPCHRVCAQSKQLGGFSGGLVLKQTLLDHEALLVNLGNF